MIVVASLFERMISFGSPFFRNSLASIFCQRVISEYAQLDSYEVIDPTEHDVSLYLPVSTHNTEGER